MNLDKLALDQWWKAVLVAGILISVAAISVKEKDGTLVGVGLFFIGAGEWINHPKHTQITPMDGGFFTGEIYPWKPSILGILFDVIGILLFGVGIYRFVFS